ncbi:hypothetical protein, partial [Leyella stercorea]|uniref:hypothetical protein n=1 Tax=Leyella stercorea TaxID=363265 RepID=UPI003AF671F2
YVEIVKESCGKKQGQYGLVIYGLSSIHDAKINNNIGLLKTQQYYLIQYYPTDFTDLHRCKQNVLCVP